MPDSVVRYCVSKTLADGSMVRVSAGALKCFTFDFRSRARTCLGYGIDPGLVAARASGAFLFVPLP